MVVLPDRHGDEVSPASATAPWRQLATDAAKLCLYRHRSLSMTRQTLLTASTLAALSLAACSVRPGSSDPFVGFGPNPPIAKPQSSLVPVVGVPEVVGWS